MKKIVMISLVLLSMILLAHAQNDIATYSSDLLLGIKSGIQNIIGDGDITADLKTKIGNLDSSKVSYSNSLTETRRIGTEADALLKQLDALEKTPAQTTRPRNTDRIKQIAEAFK